MKNYERKLQIYNVKNLLVLTIIHKCIFNNLTYFYSASRVDLDIKTTIRWRLLCFYKNISVIILRSIAVI